MKNLIILIFILFSLNVYSKINVANKLNFVIENNMITNNDFIKHRNMLMFFDKNNIKINKKLSKYVNKDIIMSKVQTAAALANEVDDKDAPHNLFELYLYTKANRSKKIINTLRMFKKYKLNQISIMMYISESLVSEKLKEKFFAPKVLITKNDIINYQELINNKKYYNPQIINFVEIKIKKRDKNKDITRILYTKYILTNNCNNFNFYEKILKENLDFKIKKIKQSTRINNKLIKYLNRNNNYFINNNTFGPIYKNKKITFYKIFDSYPFYKNELKFKINHYNIKKTKSKSKKKYNPYKTLISIKLNENIKDIEKYNIKLETHWVTLNNEIYDRVQGIYLNKKSDIYKDKNGWHLILIRKTDFIYNSITEKVIATLAKEKQYRKLTRVLHKILRDNTYLLK